MRRGGIVLLVVELLGPAVCGGPAGVSAQPPVVRYVHDELNRLIAVIDPQGNAAIYRYDAVGNILGIDRVDAPPEPGRIAITLIAPGKGKVGAAVEVFGKGFAATPAGNALTFNGTPAAVSVATPTRLLTSVPPGATTGPVAVTTTLGTATSPTLFQVIAPVTLTVTPAHASVSLTRSLQLQALDDGAPTTNVRWSVNGVPGGDPTIGTISTTGLYTAPASVPAPATVTVSATHGDDATATATATITVSAPVPAFLTAAGLSVRVASSPRVVPGGVVTALSVRASGRPGALAVAGSVAVGLEPLISAVVPAAAPQGAASTAVTLGGAGLAGATAVTFLRNGAPDPGIAVTSLTASASGSEVTVDVTVASGAVLGPRVVRVLTPAGASTAAGTGSNLFTIHQP